MPALFSKGADHDTQVHRLPGVSKRHKLSVAISADSEEELLQAAVEHAVSVHHHSDTPELRQQLRQLFRDGTPPEQLPMSGQAGSAGTGAQRAH